MTKAEIKSTVLNLLKIGPQKFQSLCNDVVHSEEEEVLLLDALIEMAYEKQVKLTPYASHSFTVKLAAG